MHTLAEFVDDDDDVCVCLWVRVCTRVEKVSVYVCLPLLPWVSNASCLWYLLTAIFEWCLLTVTVRSKALDTRGDCNVSNTHTHAQSDSAWFRLHTKRQGVPQLLSPRRELCVCVSLCVWLCGQVIMSPLKKLLRFLVLATSRQNNTQPQQIWRSIRGVKNVTASNCSDCRVDLSSCDLTHWFKDEERVFLCLSFPEHHNYQITWGDGRVFKIPTNCPVLSTVVSLVLCTDYVTQSPFCPKIMARTQMRVRLWQFQHWTRKLTENLRFVHFPS